MKRTVTLLLALLMLFSCIGLAACSGTEQDPQQTTGDANAQSTADGSQPQTKDPTALDVPKGLDYDSSFIIMTYETSIPEFCDHNMSRPDTVEAALIERDLMVQEYLNVDIVYDTSTPGNYNDRDVFAEKVRNSVNNGLKAFDLIGAYSLVPPNLALEGLLVDMGQLQYVDFEKAWYPQYMLDACTINNRTYFMASDMSSQSIFRMIGVVFSPSLLEANELSEEELYRMVYDGEWTYENWFQMCEGLARETGGDGIWDAGDFYPIQTPHSYAIDSFYPSAGFTLLEKDAKGLLKVSGDTVGEKTLRLYEMVYNAKNVTHVYYDNYDYNEPFIVNQKCIFQISALGSFRLYFGEASESYCVLPCPKYDEGNNDLYPYRTFVASHMQYCIPTDARNLECSGAVMEVMGYAGYTYLVPAIFEKTLKRRYSPTEDVANMYDIMRNGRCYDAGSAFYMTFHAYGYEDASTMFRYNVQKNTTNWTTNYKQKYEVGLHYVCRLINDFYSKEEA